MHALLPLLLLAAAPPDVARQCQGELATAPATVRPADVEYLGTFGRFESDGDHAYGAEVTLLRQAGKCVGHTRFSQGALEGDIALLEVKSCPPQGTSGKVSAHYTQSFSPGHEQMGPRQVRGGYEGTLGRKGLVLSSGKVLPRVSGTVDSAWADYVRLLRLSECVQRKLERLGQAERSLMEYALNMSSPEQNDRTMLALCEDPRGPGAGLAAVAGSAEPGLREHALTVLERLSEQPRFGGCLIAFASRHAEEPASRAFLGELVRTRPKAAAVYGQELETWARRCVKSPGANLDPCSGAAAAVRALREDVAARLETLLQGLSTGKPGARDGG